MVLSIRLNLNKIVILKTLNAFFSKRFFLSGVRNEKSTREAVRLLLRAWRADRELFSRSVLFGPRALRSSYIFRIHSSLFLVI